MPLTTIHHGSLEYLTAGTIPVPHAFTTRYGGVSRGDQASLNLACCDSDPRENVEQNIRILAGAVEFDPAKLVLTRQTHSDIVRPVTSADALGLCHRDYPECDGLVTAEAGVALLAFTADCTPVLLYDPVTGAVGAVHAGWRGTAKAIAAKAVEAMVRNYGSRPRDIRAAVGPNIAQCHFETDDDVPQAMLAAFGDQARDYIQRRGEKFHLDLKGLNALALRRAGVEDITLGDECTYCQNGRFWSHRVTRGRRGSQGAVIVCRGGGQ